MFNSKISFTWTGIFQPGASVSASPTRIGWLRSPTFAPVRNLLDQVEEIDRAKH